MVASWQARRMTQGMRSRGSTEMICEELKLVDCVNTVAGIIVVWEEL